MSIANGPEIPGQINLQETFRLLDEELDAALDAEIDRELEARANMPWVDDPDLDEDGLECAGLSAYEY